MDKVNPPSGAMFGVTKEKYMGEYKLNAFFRAHLSTSAKSEKREAQYQHLLMFLESMESQFN